MGIFSNETEEEKNYKKLLKAIRTTKNLGSEWIDFLDDYVTKINNGEIVNDLVDFEYLNRFILSLLEWSNLNNKNPKSTFKRIINILNQLIPLGEHTENYKMLMEMFVNNYCGNDGFIEKNMIDDKFYALFQNRYDYLYFMNLISKSEGLLDEFELIVSYAVDVSPYCSNQQVLKNEILSFMHNLETEYDSVDELRERMLNDAKKRCGVYSLDERELAKISAEAEKAQSLIRKLDNIKKNVDAFEERIKASTELGKKEFTAEFEKIVKDIKNLGSSTTSSMETLVANAKKEAIIELDRHLRSIESDLQTKSNQVFNKILEDAQNKVVELRRSADLISTNTTEELLRIQGESEASVNKLRQYVENDSKVQELIKGAIEDTEIKEAILSIKASGMLNAQTTTQLVTPASGVVAGENSSIIVPDKTIVTPDQTPNIVIPGYDRIISPANPSVVIPNGAVDRTVIPAFDESIPFDTRMNRILKIKAARQAKGEIFHDMTDEIIRCLMEGDWTYLWGPSGCGKSYTIKQIAELIGIDMIDNGKITDKFSIMAYNDPQGRFRATQAFVALVYGKLLLLDEFDNGNPDTQVVLNELYSGLLDTLEKPNELRYVTFAEDMRVPIHPNFRMISAGNTTGEGENDVFSSRGKIDESVQQRMTPKKFWYDNRVEERIFGEYTAWYNVFVNFRKVCDDYAKRQGLDVPIGVVTTRDASAIVKYINHNSKSIEQVLDEKFVQTKSEDYLKFIVREFADIYNLRYDDNESQNIKKLSDVKEKTIAKKLVSRCKLDRE